MELKLYQTVLLKNGLKADIDELYLENNDVLVDIYLPDGTIDMMQLVKVSDIEKIIK